MSPRSAETYWHETDTPVGRLLLVGSAAGLRRVHFQGGRERLRPSPEWRRDAAPFARALGELAEYFARTRRAFTVPLAPAGSPVQLAVWSAPQPIPNGETATYGELARRLGHPRGARAVRHASGANPPPIIRPSQRLIGADGSLTGFGGGLQIKRALLSLEGAACVADLFAD
jgi:methylated-DNA-[protein]-cysteine S-methyltransferase